VSNVHPPYWQLCMQFDITSTRFYRGGRLLFLWGCRLCSTALPRKIPGSHSPDVR